MALDTQDKLVAALASAQRIPLGKASVTAVSGRMLSMWPAAGSPGVGEVTSGQAAAGAVPTSATVGSIVFANSTVTNYMLHVSGNNAASGEMVIFDRLWNWTSGGSGWVVTTTGVQSTTSPAALTRPDSVGLNTELWVEALTVGGVASGTSTITYTNSSGVGSRTATLLSGAPISAAPIGTIQQYALQAGDAGVQSIQSINNSATWTSGTFRIMIVRRVAQFPTSGNVGFAYDPFDLGITSFQDNASLGMAFVANSTTTGPLGMVLSIGSVA